MATLVVWNVLSLAPLLMFYMIDLSIIQIKINSVPCLGFFSDSSWLLGCSSSLACVRYSLLPHFWSPVLRAWGKPLFFFLSLTSAPPWSQTWHQKEHFVLKFMCGRCNTVKWFILNSSFMP